MSDINDFNKGIIEEFRANGGVVGGPFEGMPLALVHHKGAKSGTDRVAPLAYRRHGDAYVVFGSKAGATTDPHWVLNLRANPETEVEVGTDTIAVTAREAEGDERDQIWTAQKAQYAAFAEYDEKSGDRVIPVVVLDPR